MTTTTATGSTASSASIYSQLSGNASTQSTPEASADRFLKLLVAQMQNQDPLSPMDNAQVTSQMAQINTVAGIDKVNSSIQSMSGQFAQMQALQGVQLVGQGVVVNGNALALDETSHTANASYELAGPADNAKIEVLSAAGRVIDTVDLGAETSGRHAFTWSPAKPPTDPSGITFRVVASHGATPVAATTLVRDQVVAVSNSSGSLKLDLASGNSVAYGDVKAFSS
jgi:flagellar basal-body rod modification protein FlgD